MEIGLNSASVSVDHSCDQATRAPPSHPMKFERSPGKSLSEVISEKPLCYRLSSGNELTYAP